MRTYSKFAQSGALMIEVLVTIAIVVIGLWGLMDVQSRLQKSEMESYQRTQALILLNDMVSRISVNRDEAEAYRTDTLATKYLGVGITCPNAPVGVANPAAIVQMDTAQWCDALQGAAETVGGSNVGAMVGGRGCVQELTDDEYMVTLVWQGLAPVSVPPATVTCGAGLYDLPAGSACADVPDACRRYVSTILRIGNLQATGYAP